MVWRYHEHCSLACSTSIYSPSRHHACHAKAGKIKTTFFRLPCSQYSGGELGLTNEIHSWDRWKAGVGRRPCPAAVSPAKEGGQSIRTHPSKVHHHFVGVKAIPVSWEDWVWRQRFLGYESPLTLVPLFLSFSSIYSSIYKIEWMMSHEFHSTGLLSNSVTTLLLKILRVFSVFWTMADTQGHKDWCRPSWLKQPTLVSCHFSQNKWRKFFS